MDSRAERKPVRDVLVEIASPSRSERWADPSQSGSATGAEQQQQQQQQQQAIAHRIGGKSTMLSVPVASCLVTWPTQYRSTQHRSLDTARPATSWLEVLQPWAVVMRAAAAAVVMAAAAVVIRRQQHELRFVHVVSRKEL